MRQSGNREAQLISLASDGLTDKQIGIELGISAETVASHWKRLLTKYSARSRTELIARTVKASSNERIAELTEEIERLQGILDSRKRLGARQGAAIARLQSLMDSIDVGVAFKSPERRVVFANRRMVEIFHVPGEPSELIGLTCREVVQIAASVIPDPKGLADDEDAIMDAAVPAGPITMTLSTGQILEISYVPVQSGDAVSHLWLFRDVTRRRLRQRRLENYLRLADVLAEAAPDMILGRDQNVINSTLERIGRFAGADRVWIYDMLPDGMTATRTYVWYEGADPAKPRPVEYTLRLGKEQASMYRQGLPVLVRRPEFDDILDADTAVQLRDWGVSAIVSAPILSEGELVAYLGMATAAPDDWDDDTCQLLRRFAAMLGAYRQKLNP